MSIFNSAISDYLHHTINVLGGTTRFVNLSSFSVRGVESKIDYKFYNKWDLTVSHHLLSASDKSEGLSSTDLPANRLILNTKYKASERFYVGGTARHAFSRGATENSSQGSGEPPVDGKSYTLYDLYARYKFKYEESPYTIHFIWKNILDKNYTIHPGVIPGLGSEVSVSLTYGFFSPKQ